MMVRPHMLIECGFGMKNAIFVKLLFLVRIVHRQRADIFAEATAFVTDCVHHTSLHFQQYSVISSFLVSDVGDFIRRWKSSRQQFRKHCHAELRRATVRFRLNRYKRVRAMPGHRVVVPKRRSTPDQPGAMFCQERRHRTWKHGCDVPNVSRGRRS